MTRGATALSALLAALLAALAGLAACGSSGGNLLPRRDYGLPTDAADPGDDGAETDTGRDVLPWDPGDDAFDAPPPWDPGVPDDAPVLDDTPSPPDPGHDDGLPDPGHDDGPADPGHDPGPPPAVVRLVTDKDALPSIVNLIDGAQSTLQMVELEFITGWAPDQVGAALARAAKRGVQVRVLMESDVDDNATRLSVLVAAGVEAKLDGNSKTLHTKLVVADRQRALVGSTNLSISSLNYNHEANVRLEGAALVEPYAKYADALWSKPSSAATFTNAEVAGVTPIGDGQYDARVLAPLGAARDRVLLVMYHMSDDWSGDVGDLTDAMIAAKVRGVDVRVVLESAAYEDYVNSDNRTCGQRLAASGIGVRYHEAETLTHAKVLVMDDAVAVHSGNWVHTGLNSNHEAGAVVDLPDVAGAATTYFEKIWTESVP